MTSRVRHRRSPTAGNVPPGTMEPGELAVNMADLQLFTSSAGPALSMLGVRKHTATAKYLAKDVAMYDGQLYVAKATILPKAFTPAEWDNITKATMDAHVAAADPHPTYATDAQLASTVAAYLPLAGGTLTGNLGITQAAGTGYFTVKSSAGNMAGLSMAGNNNVPGSSSFDIHQGPAGTGYIWNRYVGPVLFGTADTERMRVSETGRLGIGTTDPQRIVHIRAPQGGIVRMETGTLLSGAGATAIEFFDPSGQLGYFGFASLGGGLVIHNSKSTDTMMYVGANEQLRIDGTGRTVLGGGTPNGKFTVQAGTEIYGTLNSNTVAASALQFQSAGNFFGLIGNAGVDSSDGNYLVGLRGQNGHRLSVGNGTIQSIRTAGSNGAVLVGPGSTVDDSYRLTVSCSTANGLRGIQVYDPGAPSSPSTLLYLNHPSNSPNVASSMFLFADSTGARITMLWNGGIGNYQAGNYNISDARVKRNVAPAPDGWLDKLLAIPVHTFLLETGTREILGVVAQEVFTVAPELVRTEGTDYTPPPVEGEEPPETISLMAIWQTDYQFALLKGLQELAARVAALETPA